MDKKTLNYEVIVTGGGMTGICAAISCAREGARTALIQNRPVPGGNASSEIKMHIVGADDHGRRENARETGILEEILLENRYRNPNYSYSLFDTILWEKLNFQENLDLYLNTHMNSISMKKNKIEKVSAVQLTTESVLIKKFKESTSESTYSLEFIKSVFGIVSDYLAEIYKNLSTLHNELSLGNIKKNTDNSSILSHAIEYIKNNYKNNISINDISKACYCSNSLISHIFKRNMKVNIKSYLNKVRIEKAKVLLLTTDDTISEIAQSIGYNDSNYFSFVFKKMYDYSPSNYRNIFKEK
jgi:YesN/AraC family two-component response regulator